MRVKVYVVQRQLPDGTLDPEILAAKLTHLLAHQIAREFAPAKVTPLVADKLPGVNGKPPAAEEAARGPSRNFED